MVSGVTCTPVLLCSITCTVVAGQVLICVSRLQQFGACQQAYPLHLSSSYAALPAQAANVPALHYNKLINALMFLHCRKSS